jgi:hypothetical protein
VKQNRCVVAKRLIFGYDAMHLSARYDAKYCHVTFEGAIKRRIIFIYHVCIKCRPEGVLNSIEIPGNRMTVFTCIRVSSSEMN